MNKITTTKQHTWGKSESSWLPTPSIHCPNCGLQTLWYSPDEDDYYEGEPAICIACGASGRHVLDFYIDIEKHRQSQVAQLQTAVKNNQERLTMEHPQLDEHGYPAGTALQAITEWPYNDFNGLVKFIAEIWNWSPRYWKREGQVIHASTGGWSGYESIIDALQDNFVFWAMCWQSSRRGGHYVFELPPPVAEDTPS